MLLSGRRSAMDNVSASDPVKANKNTWVFTYLLHPKIKAFWHGQDPAKDKPLTGMALVNFKIQTSNDRYDQTSYNYAKEEGNTHWGVNNFPGLNITNAGNGDGHGFTFYYNLDWSALDDYSTQQRW
jgi:hypothetical protein